MTTPRGYHSALGKCVGKKITAGLSGRAASEICEREWPAYVTKWNGDDNMARTVGFTSRSRSRNQSLRAGMRRTYQIRDAEGKFVASARTKEAAHRSSRKAKHSGTRVNRAEGDILIEFGIVPNARTGHGWLPVYWQNGRLRGDTYAARGYDRDEALAMAKQQANEHASRYVGEWNVVVRPRKMGGENRAGSQVRMRTYKGIYYFPDFTAAQNFAIENSLPTDRIIAYVRGWAIQRNVSGPYWGSRGWV